MIQYGQQTKLSKRSDLHLSRKIWHFLGVMLIAVFYNNLSRASAIQWISFTAFLFILVDILRQQSPRLNHIMLKVFGPLMRESERNNLAGTTYLLLGVFIIISLFPRDIVRLSLYFLAIADPIASYFGVLYGKDKIIGAKSLQGTMAAFAACALICAAYFFIENLMIDRLLIVSVIGGLIGAISELIPIGKLDDNLTIPVSSAIMLWGLFFLFGGYA